jgi:hypothetical protein
MLLLLLGFAVGFMAATCNNSTDDWDWPMPGPGPVFPR